jgi:hypothetical protein
MDRIVQHFVEHGDLGHIALLLWAGGASLLLSRMLKELGEANRRFDAFVRELTLFNQRHVHHHHKGDAT